MSEISLNQGARESLREAAKKRVARALSPIASARSLLSRLSRQSAEGPFERADWHTRARAVRARQSPSGTRDRLVLELLAAHRGLDHSPAFHDGEYRHSLVILGSGGGILRAAGGSRCTTRAR